jgi:two-component system OmpR family response regulator
VAEYLLSRQTYDAAILDIGLPMMDGLAVLEGLRQTRPTLPVMLLTARDGLEDRVHGLNAGADDYLTALRLSRAGGAAERAAAPLAPASPAKGLELGRLSLDVSRAAWWPASRWS